MSAIYNLNKEIGTRKHAAATNRQADRHRWWDHRRTDADIWTDGDGTNSPNLYRWGAGLSLRYKKINYNYKIGGL